MTNRLLKLLECTKYKMWKKWQLFHATDFQSLMYPCFAFCSVLGVLPYKINGSTFEISKQRYICSTIILCVFCITKLIIFYMINIDGTIKFPETVMTLQHNCFYILDTFFMIITYVLNGPRMNLLQTIMNISSELPLNSYKKLSRLIHTKDILGFLFLIMGMIFYYSQIDFNRKDIWYKVVIPYIFLLVFLMDMLYMNCVCILKACFKRINDNLLNLREHIVNDEPHLLRRIYHEHKNPLLLMKLKALKKQHLAISDTVEMLNMIFSLQLLVTIIMTFLIITLTLYFFIRHWKIGMITNNLSHLVFDIFSIINMTYYSVKMVLIVWACETGKDVAMTVGTTVHDLLNNTSNKQIRKELQLFSLQILNCENTFSAKGLIVDVTLLVAIVTNITTYLLILIQFFVATYFCNEEVANNITQIISANRDL